MQVGTTGGEASTRSDHRRMGSITCDEHDLQQQHHVTHENHQQNPHHHPHQHQMAAAAFHVSRPSHSVSTLVPPHPLHHTSIMLDEDSFHVSRMMDNFQVIFYYSFFVIYYSFNISLKSIQMQHFQNFP